MYNKYCIDYTLQRGEDVLLENQSLRELSALRALGEYELCNFRVFLTYFLCLISVSAVCNTSSRTNFRVLEADI